ncbi:BMP family ABC transporter substrate-binding protein [Macrococcus brunensis]|uniref:BMP family ABC transporter substrate-binding protein n=1 Tax=Macrococcus brunensis TaxID=198483 RepID=UPI001EF13841|nr:BMP family ABC transporter substrate-binding protein [Macrococcus brunensis]ULG72637.1 BMP family ABC transporter substrate-binding protein [Macrococcus brunensis]
MKKISLLVALVAILLVTIFFYSRPQHRLTTIGFLFPDSMYDQTWGTEGYKGMLEIAQSYETAFFYEQNINTNEEIKTAVKRMADRNVQVLYGQGMEFSDAFNEVAAKYPDIHFVVFNGESKADNVTIINIDAYTMGYFGGMTAAHHSKTGHIGVIGSFKSQPEIEGFKDGAIFENKNIKLHEYYVKTFSYDSRGTDIAENFIKNKKVDVLFPAGDGINADIMSYARDHDTNVIGFISDQSNYGPQVLMSTQVKIPAAYVKVAKLYEEGNLKGGKLDWGIKENLVGVGKLSRRMDNQFTTQLKKDLAHYKETNLLPSGETPPAEHDAYRQD